MNGTMKRVTMMLVGASCALLAAGRADAQWAGTGYSVAEVDTKETLLLLAGASFSPAGTGIAPIIGLQVFHLSFDGGTTRTNVFTARPYVGLRNGFEGGALNATVGYALSNRDNSSRLPVGVVASDNGEGVVAAGGMDYWGTGGPIGYQALASYNFGSEAFWGRGRVSTRVSQSDGGAQKRLGAEVAFLDGRDFGAVQPGLVYEIHNGRGRILGVGAGGKFFDGGGSAAYVKFEGVLGLFR